MSDNLSGFQRAWLEALQAAQERAARDEELMLRALRGEPFWGAGKEPVSDGDLVGLAEFLPKGRK